MTNFAKITSHPLIRGKLDVTKDNIIHGWLICPFDDAHPLVYVDDKPAVLLEASMPRPDVCQYFGVKEPINSGFACRLPASPGGAVLTLHAVTSSGIYLVDRKKLGEPVGERNFLAQMAAAIPIASQKQSVAIVCWDGAHNPVGRARVLYDIASPHRPTVLVAYLHDEFGSEVWRPLQRWAGNLIAIPWSQRHVGHALLRQYGINFDTVWICKPRLPSFQLAAAISHSHTRYILDIDDDEEAFIRRQTESLCDYDAPGLGLANYLRDNIANQIGRAHV